MFNKQSYKMYLKVHNKFVHFKKTCKLVDIFFVSLVLTILVGEIFLEK